MKLNKVTILGFWSEKITPDFTIDFWLLLEITGIYLRNRSKRPLLPLIFFCN